MIIVTGSVQARPETFDQVRDLCLEHTRRSRTEPGCISHDVHVDAENPFSLVFFERWADLEALRTHFRVPASNAFMREVRRLAAAGAPMRIYQADEVPPPT
jgi:quinol monooxygenase YgiN